MEEMKKDEMQEVTVDNVQNDEQNKNIESADNGKGKATASMVLGIISVVCWFFGYSALISVILGIIGLVMASGAKKLGFNGGMRTAGFILSLIGLIGGAIIFVACVACVGVLGSAALLDPEIYESLESLA